MKSWHLRFSLLTLLVMPAMFAMGWWVRDRNYERDVYVAAEQLADNSGGIYIPELGMLHGGRELEKRIKAMSPEANAEMARRLAYYEEVMEPDFDPPRPSLWNSITSFFGISDDEEAVDDYEEVGRLGPSYGDSHSTIEDRIETFRKMRSSGSFEPTRDSLPID